MLTKADILDRVELKHKDVNVPEWGGVVRVRELTAGEYGIYQDTISDLKGEDVKINAQEMHSALLCHSIVDGAGAPMFSAKEIKTLPAKPVLKLYRVAQDLNGESADEQDEIEKN